MFISRLSNQEIYRKKLLKEFETKLPNGDLFLPILKTYGDLSDEENFFKQHAIFHGKIWSEVDFDNAKEFDFHWGPFSALSKLGEIYYLPAFLSYFYEVENLKKGNVADYFDSIFFSVLGDKGATESFTIDQSKLIALFLVNLSNLVDDTYGDEQEYQKELTSNWGHFLLF
ncbi:hypothetical protein [Vreelandella sp. GE22]